jgi:hypothetical protein
MYMMNTMTDQPGTMYMMNTMTDQPGTGDKDDDDPS